jgi:hypothetical protein
MSGVNVPYSAEFRERETNRALLEALASLQPDGGEAGRLISGDLDADRMDSLLSVDTFRRGLAPAITSRDMWPLLLLATACIFFADVFVRRVTVGFGWLAAAWQWVRHRVFRREQVTAVQESLQRLRSRKDAVADEIDVRRAATRFEPAPDANDEARQLDEVVRDASAGDAKPPSPPAPTPLAPEQAGEDSYTARLLQAKRRAWKDTNVPPTDSHDS